ncbi:hypothetical protein FVE85_9103 [Porphyridium purpureum]|uniref:Uncharacterized protein n=1 Tax=Porphyridium purpureum TaxID=35688 RepID=A0A5J4YMV5_PORPP|nr:hypothetical protein FVE85_9103 [Porphyridium purpureum]|eukprot:POR3136..scf222_8
MEDVVWDTLGREVLMGYSRAVCAPQLPNFSTKAVYEMQSSIEGASLSAFVVERTDFGASAGTGAARTKRGMMFDSPSPARSFGVYSQDGGARALSNCSAGGFPSFSDNSDLEVLNPLTGRPPLPFAPYGKSPKLWPIDIFALYHNACRSSFSDLYEAYDWAHTFYHGSETRLVLQQFYDFYAVFQAFLSRVLSMEDEVVFAWMESRCELPFELQSAQRAPVKQDIMEPLNMILEGKVACMESEDWKGTLSFLKQHIDSLVIRTTKWFRLELQLAVDCILEAGYPAKDCNEIFRSMVRHLQRGKNGNLNVVLLANWMKPEAELHNTWKYDVLGAHKLALYSIWEKSNGRYFTFVQNAQAKRAPYQYF